MRSSLHVARPALALLLVAVPLHAQGADPATATGLRKELIAQLDDGEKKLVALAEAMPQEKYGWRPGEGVRSVSEVFVHVASANYLFPRLAGVQRAPDVTLPRDAEQTITDRVRIVELLHKSFAFARQAVMDVPDAQLDDSVDMFGTPTTKRGVLVTMATHLHEHLGQSIAYARTNGVVPPWSAGGGN
ncbi:MAG TPA: DinB family protein [Gemmatimonadaceae bacterium]|nr:DinB family protein [Gemmatimonadaceae bacterium]